MSSAAILAALSDVPAGTVRIAVDADGVHPLQGGADLWAQVWQAEIDARRA